VSEKVYRRVAEKTTTLYSNESKYSGTGKGKIVPVLN
jgi:hypothetical protein